MKTVSKKLLSILLVAILLVSAIPFQAFAEGEGVSSGNNTQVDETGTGDTDTGDTDTNTGDTGTGDTDTGDTDTDDTDTGDTDTDTNTGNTGEGIMPQSEDDDSTPTGTTVEQVEHDGATHTLTKASKENADSYEHYYKCTVVYCKDYNKIVAESNHSFKNGICTVCEYECQHPNTTTNARAATCTSTGYSGDTVCTVCGMTTATGHDTEMTAHTYVNGFCKDCGVQEPQTESNTFTLTLDANGGTINGMETATKTVQTGAAVALPTPSYGTEDAEFLGWYVDNVYVGRNSMTYNYSENKTAVAKWNLKTYHLTVKVVKNGVFSTATTVYDEEVLAGTPLLDYLKENVSSTIDTYLNNTPGYRWEGRFFKDYSGTNELNSQAQIMDQAQTVYVNFVSKSYTLYFNANGGSVTPTSKTVYFGSAVGTLPTATLSGKVFQYWKDANGTIYTADTIYQVAGDTSLTAVYQDEALVILYIYINGDFSSCNRMIVMDSFVNGNNLSRSDVYAQVSKYYTPASGTLSIAGLFDEYTWSSYRANTSKAGTENIEIDDSKVNKIYVMVNNANTSATVVSGSTSTTSNSSSSTTATTTPVGSYWVSTGNGTGYWVYPASSSSSTSSTSATYIIYTYTGTNPKTGDTAQIELAAAIMVLAAGALVTMIVLRKKKA